MSAKPKSRPRKRWIAETFHPDWQVRLRADKILHEVKTKHQDLIIFDNDTWGRVLMLDGVVQLTTSDDFVYHEMMAHVPLMSLKAPRRVLVIGGGDGGVLREVLKHPSVKRATLVDIDRSVIDLSLKYYPEIANGAFDDPRTEVVIADGLKYVAETDEKFDAILVDSSEPIGPSAVLHSRAFFADCQAALKPHGILVTQNGLANLSVGHITNTTQYFAELFAKVQPYLCTQPCYFGGPFAINLASDTSDPANMPLSTLRRRLKARKIKGQYYTPEVHLAAFALPGYIQKTFDSGKAKAARKAKPRRRAR